VREVLADGVIGLSTHDAEQVDEALATVADYVAVGPVFGTAHQGDWLHRARS
jgi:thiamine monophosphate synthase